MKQDINKVMKHIGKLIAMIVVPFILSILLLDIVNSLLWSFCAQYSLFGDESSLVFILCATGAMIFLEIIGLIVYNRNKNISEE